MNLTIHHSRMTAVPTELPLDPHLCTEAKAAAAILCALGEGAQDFTNLSLVLNTPDEKIVPVFTELVEHGYNYAKQKQLPALSAGWLPTSTRFAAASTRLDTCRRCCRTERAASRDMDASERDVEKRTMTAGGFVYAAHE